MSPFAKDELIPGTSRTKKQDRILKERSDLVEHMDIYRLIKEREKTDIDEFIPLEQIVKENNKCF